MKGLLTNKKSRMMNNKKGAITDMFLFLALAFALVIFIVVMVYVANQTYKHLMDKAPLLQKALGNDGNASKIIQNTAGKVVVSYYALRWVSVLLIVGLALSILVTSFLVRTEPIFFVPYVIITIIAVICAVPISNSYEAIYQNPVLAETFTGFFGVTWIFLNLPIWVMVIGILSGILMFINTIRGGG
jgi:hypothetical protein